MDCATVWGLALHAAVAVQSGKPRQGIECLRDAIRTAEAADMHGRVAAAQRRLAELVGGKEGATLTATADEWMASEGVVNVERMTELLVPGFRLEEAQSLLQSSQQHELGSQHTRVDKQCPNCAAKLKISQGGTCELCNAHVPSGERDWVLSKIEQDESYRG